jgi:hypothetical protein
MNRYRRPLLKPLVDSEGTNLADSDWLLSEKLFWYVASIVRELLEDGLMQPHVHLGRIPHLLFWTSELGREPLSRLEAAIQV